MKRPPDVIPASTWSIMTVISFGDRNSGIQEIWKKPQIYSANLSLTFSTMFISILGNNSVGILLLVAVAERGGGQRGHGPGSTFCRAAKFPFS